jgi:hypothetical protein
MTEAQAMPPAEAAGAPTTPPAINVSDIIATVPNLRTEKSPILYGESDLSIRVSSRPHFHGAKRRASATLALPRGMAQGDRCQSAIDVGVSRSFQVSEQSGELAPVVASGEPRWPDLRARSLCTVAKPPRPRTSWISYPESSTCSYRMVPSSPNAQPTHGRTSGRGPRRL